MFWQYNTNCSSAQIEALLAKEDVTLQEIMNTDDIINECKLQNKALMDFFQKPNIMEELVDLTVSEPPQDMDERERFKYSNIACEILTCDVPTLNERLASDEVLLEKLYSFLESEPPLNPLLASFFSKILGALIAKKTEQNWLSYQFTCLQVLDFLKAKETFISFLLKHLGTSAIMDLMLKLFTQVEGVETRQNILNWLDSQRIIQSLVELMNPSKHKNIHCNVAQLLGDFIRIARENQSNFKKSDSDPLLNTLESSETVTLLLSTFLTEEKCESAIASGIQVLLALLDLNGYSECSPASNIYNSSLNDDFLFFQLEGKKVVFDNIVSAILPRLTDFHDLLVDPPKKTPLQTTIGTLDPPLGHTRLQILKLYVSVLSSNNPKFLKEILKLGTFEVVLDLFFKYPWNNFLHAQVERCLVSTIKMYAQEKNETAVALCKNILEDCNLIDKILKAWEDNEEKQKSNGIRQGYMGHLIKILNELVELSSSTYFGEYLKEFLPQEFERLDVFKNDTLKKVNTIQNSWLAGVQPNASNNNEIDFTEIPFSPLQQQAFTEYQMQPITSPSVDGFYGSFNDEGFNDVDDTVQTIDPRTDMNFDLWEGHQKEKKFEVFQMICGQSLNSLDDTDDQVFDDLEHTLQTVIEKPGEPCNSISSSDSEEELAEDSEKDIGADEFDAAMGMIRSTEKESPSPEKNQKNDVQNKITTASKIQENIKSASSELAQDMLKKLKLGTSESEQEDQTKNKEDTKSLETSIEVKKNNLDCINNEQNEEQTKTAEFKNKVDSESNLNISSEHKNNSCNPSVKSAAGDVEQKESNAEIPIQPSKDFTTVGDCSEKILAATTAETEGKENISESK